MLSGANLMVVLDVLLTRRDTLSCIILVSQADVPRPKNPELSNALQCGERFQPLGRFGGGSYNRRNGQPVPQWS
jgi:hypothetical protein